MAPPREGESGTSVDSTKHMLGLMGGPAPTGGPIEESVHQPTVQDRIQQFAKRAHEVSASQQAVQQQRDKDSSREIANAAAALARTMPRASTAPLTMPTIARLPAQASSGVISLAQTNPTMAPVPRQTFSEFELKMNEALSAFLAHIPAEKRNLFVGEAVEAENTYTITLKPEPRPGTTVTEEENVKVVVHKDEGKIAVSNIQNDQARRLAVYAAAKLGNVIDLSGVRPEYRNLVIQTVLDYNADPAHQNHFVALRNGANECRLDGSQTTEEIANALANGAQPAPMPGMTTPAPIASAPLPPQPTSPPQGLDLLDPALPTHLPPPLQPTSPAPQPSEDDPEASHSTPLPEGSDPFNAIPQAPPPPPTPASTLPRPGGRPGALPKCEMK